MKVLYIVASPRSGSTLAGLVLGSHSNAVSLGEVSFIPKLLALREPCTCGEVLRDCPEWGQVFDDLARQSGIDMRADPYEYFIGDAIKVGGGPVDREYQTKARIARAKMRGAIDLMTLNMPLNLARRFPPIPSVKESVVNTLRLYEAAARVWKKRILVDASKLHRKAIRLYQAAPEEIRILHLVRDGRGVVTSRMNVVSLETAAHQWRNYHQSTRKLLEKWVMPEHRRTVRYEDFVTAPERCLKDLCAWLGVSFEQQMIESKGDATNHAAGGNPMRFAFAEGIQGVDEKWRRTLTPDKLNVFDRIAGSLNREFGYY